jgi:hypothetical protein
VPTNKNGLRVYVLQTAYGEEDISIITDLGSNRCVFLNLEDAKDYCKKESPDVQWIPKNNATLMGWRPGYGSYYLIERFKVKNDSKHIWEK